jgi:hypothetical protein
VSQDSEYPYDNDENAHIRCGSGDLRENIAVYDLSDGKYRRGTDPIGFGSVTFTEDMNENQSVGTAGENNVLKDRINISNISNTA